jgi:hypothetical protein
LSPCNNRRIDANLFEEIVQREERGHEFLARYERLRVHRDRIDRDESLRKTPF